MRVRDVRLLNLPPSPKGFRALARFNLEVAPGATIFDIDAVVAPSGTIQVYPPPTKSGSRAASFSPELRAQIASQILTDLEEHHDQQHSIERRPA
jgi:hypothetical protein